jgi:hypothetical protein
MPIIGFYYRKGTGVPQYSPTFPRGGNAALFAVEILDVDPSSDLDAVIQHKNVDDTVWTTLATLSAMTSGVNTVTANAVKEQLRVEYTVNGPQPWSTVCANTLAPAWRPY